MTITSARFNFIQPGLERQEMSDRYRAGLAMAEFADQAGFTAITLEEHHGAENGWSPTPLVNAGMIFGRTRQVAVTISALLIPLHDPLRLAEDIAVLDLASGGRLTVVCGAGYRPSEYAQHGKDWEKRGALMDECLGAMLSAWTGEPFEYRGTTVRVTPVPFSQPHPLLLVGGTSKVAARRAARFGLPFFPAANMPDLEAYYYEQCSAAGTQGFCMMPSTDIAMLHIAEDPERAWSEIGPYLLHEATTYASWQTPDIHSSVHSHAATIEQLREEGIYRIVTPEQCIAQAEEQGDAAGFYLHPLCGGMPIDKGWESLQLFVDKVMPTLGGS